MDNSINQDIKKVWTDKKAFKMSRIIITASLSLLLALWASYCFNFPIEPDHIQFFKPISQTADGPIAMCYICIVISIGFIILWPKKWISYLLAVFLIITFLWRINTINKMVEDELLKQGSVKKQSFLIVKNN